MHTVAVRRQVKPTWSWTHSLARYARGHVAPMAPAETAAVAIRSANNSLSLTSQCRVQMAARFTSHRGEAHPDARACGAARKHVLSKPLCNWWRDC